MVEANERIADASTGAVAGSDPQTCENTPFTVPPVLKGKTQVGYKAFADANDRHIFDQPLHAILDCLHEDWLAGWTDAQQGNGVFNQESVQGIIRECYASHVNETQRLKPKSEDARQGILNALMFAIEARLSQESELKLQWKDTHLSNMPDRGKPDGILLLKGPDMGKEWRWAVAVFEIRNDNIGAKQASLKGQLLSRIVNMSQYQPRHYSLGFTMSKDGDLYIYLVMPTKVFYSKIGRLPLGESGDTDEVAVVRLLLLMYQMLPKYPGFLVTPYRGIFSPLSADNFIGIVGSDAERLFGKTITVLDDKTIAYLIRE
ncbi:hypothetical protein GGH96_000852 [Coemansia sp. RSA 1972]|nr:hypothetical protein GGH96_000852 [Coemansia sp. RSA 1972]